MPTYEVCDPSQDPESWYEVTASSPEEAVEFYCERSDSEGDYHYITQGDSELVVREKGAQEASAYQVSAYTTPCYSGRPHLE